MVEKEYRDGYLTERGYLKRRAHLLEPFEGVVVHGATPLPYTEASSPVPVTYGEEVTFQSRRLHQVSSEDVGQVEYVAQAKRKELTKEEDMNR